MALFDPETITDHFTFAKPFELPTGVAKVLVNGEIVWDGGRPTGARPGKVLQSSNGPGNTAAAK